MKPSLNTSLVVGLVGVVGVGLISACVPNKNKGADQTTKQDILSLPANGTYKTISLLTAEEKARAPRIALDAPNEKELEMEIEVLIDTSESFSPAQISVRRLSAIGNIPSEKTFFESVYREHAGLSEDQEVPSLDKILNVGRHRSTFLRLIGDFNFGRIFAKEPSTPVSTILPRCTAEQPFGDEKFLKENNTFRYCLKGLGLNGTVLTGELQPVVTIMGDNPNGGMGGNVPLRRVGDGWERSQSREYTLKTQGLQPILFSAVWSDETSRQYLGAWKANEEEIKSIALKGVVIPERASSAWGKYFDAINPITGVEALVTGPAFVSSDKVSKKTGLVLRVNSKTGQVETEEEHIKRLGDYQLADILKNVERIVISENVHLATQRLHTLSSTFSSSTAKTETFVFRGSTYTLTPSLSAVSTSALVSGREPNIRITYEETSSFGSGNIVGSLNAMTATTKKQIEFIGKKESPDTLVGEVRFTVKPYIFDEPPKVESLGRVHLQKIK